ncbi:Uncharacterised protein [Mycobacteroides abscessus]|nr:Uncharacterised protein [Mycobacteroides abscessus]
MTVYVGPAVGAAGSGVAILIGGLQTWVTITGSGVLVNISGMGEFSSPNPLTSAALAARHGFPIAWVTGAAGVVIILSAAMHLLGSASAKAIAMKGIALPALASGVASIGGLLKKAELIRVQPYDLTSVQLSAGYAPWVVIVASAVALFLSFSLVGLDEIAENSSDA